MNKKILTTLAALVLGSSSLAMAAPAYRPIEASRPVVQPIAWHGPAYRTVTLASGVQLGNDGRTFITVGGQAGRFATLTLNAAGGRTFIKQVYVQFENGQEQVIRNLNRTLAGGGELTLDLDGGRRAIKRIVVYGTPVTGGWRRANAAIDVTAA
jgi:hypothetical protein